MRLKRIEIFGFKSFAKKLDLKLLGGITAVVGPNGCGKTNVVDAIRWVLGEQRPTQIRLDRMEDVLFKGSVSRRQLGIAEVNLTIDNDAGILPLDMPEITITRRLFRTGESDYMINKKICRLADINELFMDTGMGTDSYSMFEQDMVNSILSDKAEDRRHIFEEAAGVTKYKTRRRSALGKLAGIEDDLERVGDIITELERRVESLKRQASKAARYRKLKTEIKDRTIAIAAIEINELTMDIGFTYEELEALKINSELAKTKSAQLTAESERIAVDIVSVEKKLGENAAVFNENITAINEKEKELVRLGSRLDYIGEKAEHAREESRRTTEAIEKLAENHGRASGDLNSVSSRLDEVKQSSSALVEGHRTYENKVRDKGSEYSAIEQEYRNLEKDLAEQRTALETVRVWGENGRKRLEEINDRSSEVEKNIIEAEAELERLGRRQNDSSEKECGITEQISSLNESLGGKISELEELDNQFRELREEEAAIRAERDFLAEIVRSCEGYTDGVRNAVGSEELKDRVLGVLGDLISADNKYTRAIETALEDRLQNVLVRTRDDALAGIRLLSEKGQGRATFLPLDTTANKALNIRIPEYKGVHGPAYDFVKTEDRFKKAVQHLLAGVIIVDTIETALELQRATEGLTFVTLDGEKAGFMGDLHGGTVNDEEGASAIGRVEQLEKLNGIFKGAAAAIETLKKKRERLLAENDYLRASIKEQETALETVRNEIRNLKSEKAGVSAKKEAASEMLTNWTAEGERIRSSFRDYESEKVVLEKDVSLKNEELERVGDRLKSAAEELNTLRIELEGRRSEINEYSVEKAALTEKKASLEREMKFLEERRETLSQTSNRITEDIETTEREILEAGQMKSDVLEEIEKLSSRHEQLKAVKDETEHRHADLSSQRSEMDRKLQNIRRELAEIAQQENSLTLTRDQATIRMESVIKRLEDEFYIKADDIPVSEVSPDFDPEQERLILDDLRRKLQNTGDVNMAAETDYREEKERLDFLKNERKDLKEARDAILETISKINHIARRRFMETFDLIRQNFQKSFNDFFDGGVCDLKLEDEADPLEAKIFISARPPGKNVRSINLLSSGERALTAIALLFAIYQVKPSPFCILDEVDAPLDDANIDRYLRVIRRFSKTTQFIMVTHNKKTMSAADNLYGITMEEPGLSSLVSVRLSRVDAEVESEDMSQKAEVRM